MTLSCSCEYRNFSVGPTQTLSTGDPSLKACFAALKAADYVIENDGTFEELIMQIETILSKLDT